MKNFGSISTQDKLLLFGYLAISVSYGILFAMKVKGLGKGK